MRRSWVEVSLSLLRKNVTAIGEHLSKTSQIMAIVKANAYGHGIDVVAPILLNCGVREFGVVTLAEAVELRNTVRQARILVLGGCLQGEEDIFRKQDLTAAVFDDRKVPKDVRVELKIDTGMTRLGVPWGEAPAILRQLGSQVTGVYSHFACADTDPDFTRLQLQRFEQATQNVSCRRHISDSAALQFSEAHLDAVRIGLALYGIPPCPALDYVKPILQWKTMILSLKGVGKGQPVGYGRTFFTERESKMGALPVGYGDGYSRALSNRGQVRFRDRLVPVVGRISMDLTMVDLTDFPAPEVGEEILLLEDEAESPISALGLSRTLKTIPYEILTSIGNRVTRMYTD